LIPFLSDSAIAVRTTRSSRAIEGQRHMRPFGLADFLPRRANVVAGRLHAEAGGVLAVALSA